MYAAFGLVLVMVGAGIFHATRGEMASIGNNSFIAAVVAFIGYGRWKLEPISLRD